MLSGVCCINNARQKIKWCQRWPGPPRHKEDKVDGKCEADCLYLVLV